MSNHVASVRTTYSPVSDIAGNESPTTPPKSFSYLDHVNAFESQKKTKLTQLRMPQQPRLKRIHGVLSRPPIDRTEIHALVRPREVRHWLPQRGRPAEGDERDIAAAHGALAEDLEAVV